MSRSAIGSMLVLVLASFLAPSQATATQIATFVPLGPVPGSTTSRALAVSADGRTVVGATDSISSPRAFRWTAEEGMVALGDLPGGTAMSIARAVSADGSVIVGQSDGANGPEAFRWTAEDGMVGLGDLPGGEFSSEALGVSADGSVVVGVGRDTTLLPPTNTPQAFRWDAQSGMVGLGALPSPFGGSSRATAISGDGTVIAGESGIGAPFYWTADTGMIGLQPRPPGNLKISAVSHDGSLLVGWAQGPGSDPDTALFWDTTAGTVEVLGNGQALDVTDDGSLVVGLNPNIGAAIWDDEHGLRSLQTVLETVYDLDLGGWVLLAATGVTPDGSVIVGYGRNPSGRTEAFLVRLLSVPEPGSITLLGVGLAAIATRRRAVKNPAP